MLSGAFFFSVFASVLWVIYALSQNTGSGINEFAVTTSLVVLPVFILWSIFGYIYQYVSASVLNKNMYSLFKQMKKNQDYSDLIAKVLLEAEQEIKDNTVLTKFDVFVADMNELLSDILQRGQLVDSEYVDKLWVKVKNGGKWAFGKVIVELNQNQPNLPTRLLQKSLQDSVLGGTILEFCSRYQNLISALEKHDKERIFLNVIETGVFGKVFSLLASPADSIRQNRELKITHSQMSSSSEENALSSPQFTRPIDNTSLSQSRENDRPNNTNSDTKPISEQARRLFFNTFARKRKVEEEPAPEPEKDPLSMAFEKSFGSSVASPATSFTEEPPMFETTLDEYEKATNVEEVEPTFDTQEQPLNNTEPTFENSQDIIIAEHSAPVFDISSSLSRQIEPSLSSNKEEPVLESPLTSSISKQLEDGFAHTQSALADIRQEWDRAKQRDLTVNNGFAEDEGMPAPKVVNDDEYSYPFGGWTNADNYNK